MPQKNFSELSDIQWNVNPYKYLEQLRDAYQVAVVSAVRKGAYELAPEIETWMKENAPWHDRPEAQRVKENRGHHPHARATLKAEVIEPLTDLEVGIREGELTRARTKDIAALKNLNEQRKLQNRIPLKSLPKNVSSVAAVTAAWKKKDPQVYKIRMYYSNPEAVPYGIWLEIAHGGRYNILARATAYWGQKFENKIRSYANLRNIGVTPLSNAPVRSEVVGESYTQRKPAKKALKKYRKEKALFESIGQPRPRKTRSDKGKRKG